jgi:hypothetical protein
MESLLQSLFVDNGVDFLSMSFSAAPAPLVCRTLVRYCHVSCHYFG